MHGRQPDLYEDSPDRSEYNTGSTLFSRQAGDKTEQIQSELCGLNQDIVVESQSTSIGNQNGIGDCENGLLSSATRPQDILPPFNDLNDHDGVIEALSSTEFSSPLHVTPIFRSLAAGIPSPQFSVCPESSPRYLEMEEMSELLYEDQSKWKKTKLPS